MPINRNILLFLYAVIGASILLVLLKITTLDDYIEISPKRKFLPSEKEDIVLGKSALLSNDKKRDDLYASSELNSMNQKSQEKCSAKLQQTFEIILCNYNSTPSIYAQFKGNIFRPDTGGKIRIDNCNEHLVKECLSLFVGDSDWKVPIKFMKISRNPLHFSVPTGGINGRILIDGNCSIPKFTTITVMLRAQTRRFRFFKDFGIPLPKNVYGEPQDYYTSYHSVFKATIGEEFNLTGLTPGIYQLNIECEGYAYRDCFLPVNDITINHDMFITRAGSLKVYLGESIINRENERDIWIEESTTEYAPLEYSEQLFDKSEYYVGNIYPGIYKVKVVEYALPSGIKDLTKSKEISIIPGIQSEVQFTELISDR